MNDSRETSKKKSQQKSFRTISLPATPWLTRQAHESQDSVSRKSVRMVRKTHNEGWCANFYTVFVPLNNKLLTNLVQPTLLG